MAVEARRACGYRKVGGMYLVAPNVADPCCKLPIIFHVCPTCNGGIKQTQGWQWIDPKPWLRNECRGEGFGICPGSDPATLGERVGLVWVGTQFYKQPQDFLREASAMGISRRIAVIPHKFKLGDTWVFLAHPRVAQGHVLGHDGQPTEELAWLGGVFRIFKPTRIEQIVTQSQSEDPEFMSKLERRNITPVIVPDDDRDHQGSVYDRPAQPVQQEVQLHA